MARHRLSRYVGPSAPATLTVEYTKNGTRACKTFTCVYAARRFYAGKYRDGKDPKIVGHTKAAE